MGLRPLFTDIQQIQEEDYLLQDGVQSIFKS